MVIGGRESVTVVHCGGGDGGYGMGWVGAVVAFFVLGRYWKRVIHACRFLFSESVIGGRGAGRGGEVRVSPGRDGERRDEMVC